VRLLVAGAGGHAKVVVDAAQMAGFEIAGVVGHPQDPSQVQGVNVSHDVSSIDADAFVIAVGDNRTRSMMFAEYTSRGLHPVSVIHPSAIIARTAVIGAGTFIAAGVIVNADAVVGANVILNTACTVDHDCRIGDHAHLGPNVSLCGAVTVEEGALMGVGACALAGTTVGSWTVVGAGAAVICDLPPSSTSVGVPARPIRQGESS